MTLEKAIAQEVANHSGKREASGADVHTAMKISEIIDRALRHYGYDAAANCLLIEHLP